MAKDVSTMDELNAIKNTKNIGDKIEIKLYRKSELKNFYNYFKRS